MNLNNQNILIFKKVFIIFLVLLSFSVFHKTEAVSGIDSLIVSIYPKNPNPGEEVRLKLKSYSFDIDTVDTTVIVNNKIIDSGLGLKEAKFKIGGAGKLTKILISSKKINGQIITKEINIIPASVKLTYELDNPQRPFNYQGRSVPVSNSSLTVYASPNFFNENGKKISKNSLIFTWYKNNNIDVKNSGLGKSSYRIETLDAYPKETVISVLVTDISKKIKAKEMIYFNPDKTQIEFYLLEPSLPFLFRNIANPSINSPYLSTKILAVPYFVNLDKNRMTYKWKVNGIVQKKDNGLGDNKILLLNSNENFTNNIGLELEARNDNRFLQSARKSIKVIFQKKENLNNDIFFRKSSSEKNLENNLFEL